MAMIIDGESLTGRREAKAHCEKLLQGNRNYDGRRITLRGLPLEITTEIVMNPSHILGGRINYAIDAHQFDENGELKKITQRVAYHPFVLAFHPKRIVDANDLQAVFTSSQDELLRRTLTETIIKGIDRYHDARLGVVFTTDQVRPVTPPHITEVTDQRLLPATATNIGLEVVASDDAVDPVINKLALYRKPIDEYILTPNQRWVFGGFASMYSRRERSIIGRVELLPVTNHDHDVIGPDNTQIEIPVFPDGNMILLNPDLASLRDKEFNLDQFPPRPTSHRDYPSSGMIAIDGSKSMEALLLYEAQGRFDWKATSQVIAASLTQTV